MSTTPEQTLFYVDLNKEIDRHLAAYGTRNLPDLVSTIEAMMAVELGELPADEDAHYPFYLDDENLYEMSLPSVILSHAIVRKMNVFDLNAIITDLGVTVLDYVDAFDGIDCFEHTTPGGQLVDPLTLSAAAVQALAFNPRALSTFKGVAHHGYMRFAALVAAGAAGNLFTSVLGASGSPRYSKTTKVECNDIAVGLLTWLSSLDHLPNRSIDHFLEATGVLELEVLTKLHPSENAWEQMICSASASFRESSLSQAILEKLFSEEFLARNEDKVACLLNNLSDIQNYEFDENPASYRALMTVGEKSKLKGMFNLPHVLIGMMGERILIQSASDQHLPLYQPLIDKIEDYGSGFLNASLEHALDVPDAHVGFSLLKLAHTLKLYDKVKPQDADPILVAKFLKKVAEPYQYWMQSNVYESHYGEDTPLIGEGLTYLFCLPGVQASMSEYINSMSLEQTKLFVSLGLDIRLINKVTDEVATAVFGRDLGL